LLIWQASNLILFLISYLSLCHFLKIIQNISLSWVACISYNKHTNVIIAALDNDLFEKLL